jgi:Cupin superfamily protein
MLLARPSCQQGAPVSSAVSARKARAKVIAKAAVSAASEVALEVTAPLPWSLQFQEHFLQHYWQKRPLLVREAYPKYWRSPVEPDELAGFACEGCSDAGKVAGSGADEESFEGGECDDEGAGLRARVIMQVRTVS